MDEIVKMLIEKAKAEGAEVHIVHVNADEPKGEPEPKAEELDPFIVQAMKEAAEIATLNKILFDAHVAAGFDETDALELTCATITSK